MIACAVRAILVVMAVSALRLRSARRASFGKRAVVRSKPSLPVGAIGALDNADNGLSARRRDSDCVRLLQLAVADALLGDFDPARAEHGPHRVLQEQPQLSRIPNSAERFGNLVRSRAEAGNRGCSELLLQENVHRESQSPSDRRASLRTSFH